MLCSTDFRRTMEFAVRYHQLATPLATIAFHELDRMGIWTIEPLLHPRIDSLLYRFVTELQIATHISLQRDIMGDSFKPREILLSYRIAKDFQITPSLVGCPVRFEQATNQIEFDSAFLDAAPKLGNRTTYPSAIALCDDLIADLVSRSGAAGRVRSLLSTDVSERPSFATVAKRLRTTPRTLRRQLRMHNTSFRELSDELRVHVALRYLRETTMTMEDIAFALGFQRLGELSARISTMDRQSAAGISTGGRARRLSARRLNIELALMEQTAPREMAGSHPLVAASNLDALMIAREPPQHAMAGICPLLKD